jgi:hypothetical protein
MLTDVSEEYITSIFIIEEEAKSLYGRDTLIQNFTCVLPNYTALNPRNRILHSRLCEDPKSNLHEESPIRNAC